MFILPCLQRRLLALILVGGIGWTTVASATAGDCGCEIPCDAMSVDSDRSCQRQSGPEQCHLYNALDFVAGSIEKVLGLDKCGSRCDEKLCDDGCDTVMIEDLRSPLPPPLPSNGIPGRSCPTCPLHSKPVYAAPLVAPAAPAHPRVMPSVPAPESSMRITQPRVTDPQAAHDDRRGMSQGPGNLAEPENGFLPPPVRMPRPDSMPNRRSNRAPPTSAPIFPEPELEPKQDGGSLFDALSDPFRDDEVHIRRNQPIRPSSYEPELRPISKRSLSQSYETSSRRVKSVR